MSVPPLQHGAAIPSTGPGALEPRPVTDAEALEILERRFPEFDVGADPGHDAPDTRVSRGDLEAIRDGSNDQELVDAANHLLQNQALFAELDVAGEGGDPDGLISRKDLTSHVVRSRPGMMPLLGEARVQGSDADPTVLTLDVAAAGGVDWGNRDGTRAGIVSVYVDGEYFADATVFAENPDGSVQVNLGVLGAGAHRIELRDSTAVGTGATGPGVVAGEAEPVSARNLDTSPVDPGDYATADAYERAVQARDQALAARYAPHLALGDEDQATNNAPLMTTAQVIHHDDGSITIAYRILYSNEDGGDGEDPARLANRWGRTTDDERVYEVTLDAQGRPIDFSGKNGAGGVKLPDDEEGLARMDQALGPGGLPALAIANGHNNVAWDTAAAAGEGRNRSYSGVPVMVATAPATGRDASNEPGPPTNQVMADHPWTWAVANAEMEREGKAGEVQPQQRLYLGLEQGVFEERLLPTYPPMLEPVLVVVTLREGEPRTRTFALEDVKGSSNSVSLLLPFPPGAVASVRVEGVDDARLQAYYLEDDQPVEVAVG